MVIVETHVFTKLICDLLSDEQLRRLQLALLLRPQQGVLVPGGSGLRKLRWGKPGRGKRGGLRVLYYWDSECDRIYMIYVYDKTKASDLSKAQLTELARVVREEFR